MYKKYYPDRTLEHSAKGSQKKNHKYLSRIWKNGKWLYQYAKNTAKNIDNAITGNGYREQATRYYNLAGTATEDVDPNSSKFNPRKKEYRDKMIQKGDEMLDKSENSLIERMEDMSVSDVAKKAEGVAKSAKRSAEKVKNISKEKVDRGRKLINEFFSKSKPKVTVTDTFTGKKRTPKKPKSASDTVNIKELSKKNKKK